jgi:hypothetical protein
VIAFLADRPFISELGSGANRQLTERQNCTSHFSAAQPMSRAPKYLASSTRQSRGRDSLRDIVNYFQRFFENKRQTVVARKLLSNCGVLLRLH